MTALKAESPDNLITALLRKLDLRLLLLLCMVLGALTWSVSGLWLLLPLSVSCCLLYGGLRQLPWFKKFLRAYLVFAIFWMLCSFLLLELTAPGALQNNLTATAILAMRFACLPGLALPLLLAASPIKIGRACAWYAELACKLFLLPASRILPHLRDPESNPGWKVGLAVTLTISFIPRMYRDIGALGRNLTLRAPGLKTVQKAKLLCLGALRLFGEQSWEQSLTLHGRGLDRPEAWRFLG